MQQGVNDILGRFVTENVYDVRNNKQKYIEEKEQFINYMKNKPKSEKDEGSKQRKFLQKRVKYLNVDSRDRDIDLYPNSNKYTINVSKENFTNVTKIQMVGSKFVNPFADNDDIFITSNTLGSDYRNTNDHMLNLFGKIQMPGNMSNHIFNSYIGCKKVYYNNSLLDVLGIIDFQFRKYDGTLVDFQNTEHSFVLQITELIKKVEKTDYNTKIGVSFYEDEIYDTYI